MSAFFVKYAIRISFVSITKDGSRPDQVLAERDLDLAGWVHHEAAYSLVNDAAKAAEKELDGWLEGQRIEDLHARFD